MARAIVPLLMFDGNAEDAINLYIPLFAGFEVVRIERYRQGEAGRKGTVKRADLALGTFELIFTDSPTKHDFTFTASSSLYVDCDDEDELEEAFRELSAGGEVLMPLDNYGFSERFGWVKDRYGVSWQLNLP